MPYRHLAGYLPTNTVKQVMELQLVFGWQW